MGAPTDGHEIVWLNSARTVRGAGRGRRPPRPVAGGGVHSRSPEQPRCVARTSRRGASARGGRPAPARTRRGRTSSSSSRSRRAFPASAAQPREVAVGAAAPAAETMACGGTRRRVGGVEDVEEPMRASPCGRSTGCADAPAPDPAGSPAAGVSSSPATASRLSRTASASSRLVGKRQSKRCRRRFQVRRIRARRHPVRAARDDGR